MLLVNRSPQRTQQRLMNMCVCTVMKTVTTVSENSHWRFSSLLHQPLHLFTLSVSVDNRQTNEATCTQSIIHAQCPSAHTHTHSSDPPFFPHLLNGNSSVEEEGNGGGGGEWNSRVNHLPSEDGNQTYLSCRKTAAPPTWPLSQRLWLGLWVGTCTCQSLGAPYLEEDDDDERF